MKKNLLTFFTLFSFLSLFGQEKVVWEKSIGGEHAEYLHNAIATPDYGFLLLGSSASDATGDKAKKNQGNLDYFIWKMDENGKPEWQQSFGGASNDQLYTATVTSEGGFLLVGSSISPKSGDKTEENQGNEDLWILKLSPLGDIEWQKTLGGNGNDIPVVVIRTTDNGYLIGANSNSIPSSLKSSPNIGGNDYWIIKLNAKGELEWEHTYGGENNDVLRDIAETDEGYVIIGDSNSLADNKTKFFQHNGQSSWGITINKKGEILDELIFSTEENLFVSFQEIESGYLFGIQEKKKNNQIILVEMDKKMNEKSVSKLEINPSISINQVKKENEGYIISANEITTSINNEELQSFLKSKYIFKTFDQNGKEKYSKSFGENGYSYLQKTLTTRDGSLILFGNSSQQNKGNKGQSDFYLVKLGKETDDIKRNYIEVYPNPTKDIVNVLINKDFEKANVEVYNLVGQHLQSKEVKYRSTPISLGDYPGGIYILKINYDNQTESIKIIKK